MKRIDAHTHIYLRDSFDSLYETARQFGYDKIAIQSLQPVVDQLQNLTCVLCKFRYPKTTYIFGGFDYQNGISLLEQAKHLMAMGFDGFKMIEGKPTARKRINLALDDACYDPFYSYCEENQLPILMHVADPEEFWDITKAPQFAIDHGWIYDETFVAYKQLYVEVEGLLAKHPNLTAIFAHFYFLSGDVEQAQRFLDTHPNVYIDLTSGSEMYDNFKKDLGLWREFFVKNADRLIYGTDSTNRTTEGVVAEIQSINETQLAFLDSLEMDQTVLDKIMFGNFEKCAGTEPKALDMGVVEKEIVWMRENLQDSEKKELLEKIAAELLK